MRSIVSLTTSVSVVYCLSKLNNSSSGTQRNRFENTIALPACTSSSFFLSYRVKSNKHSFWPKQSPPVIKWGQSSKAIACSTCVSPPHRKLQKILRLSFILKTETIVQTSLHVTQAYRLHSSPVSGDVINYTYIDRNNIHYSWASQRQSYFPPFQHDEKILNNRPPLQTSAFQRSRLTLKRLKSKLLSYQRITAQDQRVSNCWWLCGFPGQGFCFVFVFKDKAGAFKPFRWELYVHQEWIGVQIRLDRVSFNTCSALRSVCVSRLILSSSQKENLSLSMRLWFMVLHSKTEGGRKNVGCFLKEIGLLFLKPVEPNQTQKAGTSPLGKSWGIFFNLDVRPKSFHTLSSHYPFHMCMAPHERGRWWFLWTDSRNVECNI